MSDFFESSGGRPSQQEQGPIQNYDPLLAAQSNITQAGGVRETLESTPHVAELNSNQSSSLLEIGIIIEITSRSGYIKSRNAEIFFDVSQGVPVSDSGAQLKVGDVVTFSIYYNTHTGQPFATAIKKLMRRVLAIECRSHDSANCPLRPHDNNGPSSSNTETGTNCASGQIELQRCNHTFIISFDRNDVEDHITIRLGDKVYFVLSKDQIGGFDTNRIRLESMRRLYRYRGIVSVVTATYGFIERSDVAMCIIFYMTEFFGENLSIGDNVDFNISLIDGHDRACNIIRLPTGAVRFLEVDTTFYIGRILELHNSPNDTSNEPMTGRLAYNTPEQIRNVIPYGNRDQKGCYTLYRGDFVKFQLVTEIVDRRVIKRATNIKIVPKSFRSNGEDRERGTVISMNTNFGFLICPQRNLPIYFNLMELIDTSPMITVNDEVEFTATNVGSGVRAIRITHMSTTNELNSENIICTMEGIIQTESWLNLCDPVDSIKGGYIEYTEDGEKKAIIFFLHNCESPPKIGDRVRFAIRWRNSGNMYVAVKVEHLPLLQPRRRNAASNGSAWSLDTSFSDGNADGNAVGGRGSAVLPQSSMLQDDNDSMRIYQGFISVICDAYGFIETAKHDEQVFFKYSNYTGNPDCLELGQEMEYTLAISPTQSNINRSASSVRPLPRGFVRRPIMLTAFYKGVIKRPLRHLNARQSDYAGIIEVQSLWSSTQYEYGITGLVNMRPFLPMGTTVSFRIDETGHAADIMRHIP